MALSTWLRTWKHVRGDKNTRNRRLPDLKPRRCRISLEALEDRTVPSGFNPNERIDTSLAPDQLASLLVGPGVEISNVQFTGGAASSGSFAFNDPTVLGFGQGLVLSSGSAADVVGPNMSDSTSTDFMLPGDADLDALSGYGTFDATVLEFDFVPDANQVVFHYVFASDEYPEWVNTPYNDVFAFFVNGVNHAVVRETAGDPNAPLVSVAVNNINNGNPDWYPEFTPRRPDLFRANYFNPNGPSIIDLESDGLTDVLTFQAPVNPGVVNHMKLAIADASDGIYDSAVFIQSGSLVSNENPVADLSITPASGIAPLPVTAYVEGEDPNGLPLTYTISWGDGTFSSGPLDQPVNQDEKTAAVNHVYTTGGSYIVTLTVSNGTLAGTSTEDVEVFSTGNTMPVITGQPVNQTVVDQEIYTFSASATGTPTPSVQWQISTDGGTTFADIPGATETNYSATASLADHGTQYRAVFTNSEGSATTDAATLTVNPAVPVVNLTDDTGFSATDHLTNLGTLLVTGMAPGAIVEYSTNGGATWNNGFTAVEGINSLLVRQSVDGRYSGNTSFTFTLDTTLPVLSPTFSQPAPFLVNATGITVSGNPTDASGIFWQTSGVVNTSTPGQKYVTCTATDNAGNTATVNVPYVVGYNIVNIKPVNGATFKRTAKIPVSFQLADANGVISDQAAASLAPSIRVTFQGLPSVGVKYNKKTNTFSVTLFPKQPAGTYNLTIKATVGGTDIALAHILIHLV